MSQKSNNWSLQITISVLFILLILALGAILIYQNYTKTSDILLSSADEVYKKLTDELELDIKGTYSPLAGFLQILAISPLTMAESFDDRLKHLEAISIALKNNPAATSIQIAYPDGGYFIVRSAKADIVKTKLKAPQSTVYIVENIETDKYGERQLTRLYLDENLETIARNPAEPTDYDPRNRLWYLEATDQPVATKPYIFYFTRQIGITAKLKSREPGVVVATDITLDQLTKTINNYQITPSTEAVLIDAKGQTFAYKDPDKVIISNNDSDFKLADLDQLGSEVLTHLSKDIQAIEQKINFEYDNKHWTGTARIVGKPGGVDLFALVISPVDELLREASDLRNQSFMVTAFTILLFIPVIWLVAKRISTSLHKLSDTAEAISRFDFEQPSDIHSYIKEVHDLSRVMELMRNTINRFIKMIKSLADEQDLEALLHGINRETMEVSEADAVLTYLMNDTEDALIPGVMCTPKQNNVDISALPEVPIENDNELVSATKNKISSFFVIDENSGQLLTPVLDTIDTEAVTVIAVPLSNRNNEIIGILCLLYIHADEIADKSKDTNLSFIQALSGFAAVTLESRQLLHMQEALLNAFIKLIAGAIDAKSPYTGGHCQRVPEITRMLAEAACASNEPPFDNFQLSNKEWEALDIASWLHDCGKVTTPEYVVDKATKLETIYDRIHEVRMRFEVLKRDAIISFWKQVSAGGNRSELESQLNATLKQIDDDYTFIAECNEGGEFMADDKIERLQQIAERTWQRTLDDRIGISWEESQRKQRSEKQPLPVTEKLLADKPEHIIERQDYEKIPVDNPWGFKLDVPEYKYNRGEIYNLSVGRGTLSDEERYKINDHMTQTIMMLEQLPYPKHLREVPKIAGGHHETMDGKGYPRRLTKDDMSLTARMMAIADIFEALTASDRPYKKPKTLSESIRIMSFMKKDNHIDPDLFDLFLTSGVYMKYANKFLEPDQIDEVDINDYINSTDG